MAIMGILTGCLVISVYSQEDITHVRDSAFGERMRPAVSFLHDEHNEKAGVEDCMICHHVYEDGVKTDDGSEGMECSECHTLNNPKNPIPLAKYYHLQCKGCHQAEKAGPVACGECHKE
jgi:hypothetical protein